MTRIEILSEAYKELESARQWYEERSRGLGGKFLDEVDWGMNAIRDFPDTWPLYIHGTRRVLLHRFPFAIVYLYDGEKVYVIALMHLRRKPGYWGNRVV